MFDEIKNTMNRGINDLKAAAKPASNDAQATAAPTVKKEPVQAESRPNPFAVKVNAITNSIAKLLIEKNNAYGNSALDPVRVFSKSDTVEQLKVRIDDKLSRIAKGKDFRDEDVIDDLIGYLVLLKISMEK